MNVVIYTLCTLTSLLCAVLLLRAYLETRYRLLFWSGICFTGITLNNVLVIADKIIFPDVYLTTLRLSVALLSLLPLLYGLIFEE